MYPLWAFGDSNLTVITRGSTQEEAFQYASRHWGRGQTVVMHNWLPIEAKAMYEVNHSPGWLHRMPRWLMQKVAAEGVDAQLAEIEQLLKARMTRIESASI